MPHIGRHNDRRIDKMQIAALGHKLHFSIPKKKHLMLGVSVYSAQIVKYLAQGLTASVTQLI
jgi:hypothetical protein